MILGGFLCDGVRCKARANTIEMTRYDKVVHVIWLHRAHHASPLAGAVDGAVARAVDGAVAGAVNGAAAGAVDGAVAGAVEGAVAGAVDGAVAGAVDGAVADAVDGAVSLQLIAVGDRIVVRAAPAPLTARQVRPSTSCAAATGVRLSGELSDTLMLLQLAALRGVCENVRGDVCKSGVVRMRYR